MAENSILSVIFCDDIRTEQSGKHIAIGIYNGAVSVPAFPVILPSFAVRIELTVDDCTKYMNFRFTDPLGNSLASQKIAIEFHDRTKPGAVSLNLAGALFSVAGEYKVQIGFDDAASTFERAFIVDRFDPEKAAKQMEDNVRRMAEFLRASQVAS